MGEVKEAIKRPKSRAKKFTPGVDDPGGVLVRLHELSQELDRLTVTKEQDIETEKGVEAENTRKAAVLRAVATLTLSSIRLLEDY